MKNFILSLVICITYIILPFIANVPFAKVVPLIEVDGYMAATGLHMYTNVLEPQGHQNRQYMDDWGLSNAHSCTQPQDRHDASDKLAQLMGRRCFIQYNSWCWLSSPLPINYPCCCGPYACGHVVP